MLALTQCLQNKMLAKKENSLALFKKHKHLPPAKGRFRIAVGWCKDAVRQKKKVNRTEVILPAQKHCPYLMLLFNCQMKCVM